MTASHKMKLFPEVSPKSLDLRRVICLLEDPLTTNLKERHLFVLKKVLKKNESGFLLRELTYLSQILNICAEKVKDHPKYASFLSEAIEICRFPFLKERASDELTYAQDVAEFLSNMGLQPTSPLYRLQLLERSDLPRTMLLSTAALHNQVSVKLQLLETLQLLCSSSDMNCVSILDAGGAETVCLHMNEADQSGRVLLCCSEILWSLLESSSSREAQTQLSSIECVLSLKEAFSSALELNSQGSELRNHLLVIMTFISGNPSCPLVESLFAKQLLSFITFPEFNGSSAQKHGSEDLKTRKLWLHVLVAMSRNVAALQLLREELVMVSLLQLAASPHSSVSQREGLRLQVLETLACVAPVMLQDYLGCQGNTYLLLLLDWCIDKDAGASRKAQMRRCIRVLRSVTALGERAVNQDLCDQGAISQLLGITVLMDADSEQHDVATVEMMSNIQLILSALCESDLHRKDLFGSEGVEMVVRFLKKGLERFYSGLGHNKLLISTVDCVWSCILGCCVTEDQFLARDGASLLLDLLAAAPRCVHSIILSMLLDLCNNPNARPQVLSWRDAGGVTAPRVLLQLWREEEEELGVLRSCSGGIKDPTKPLLTRAQMNISGRSFPPDTPSAAVLETSENVRVKIYLLFCSLGFRELPGLSAEDYVTLGIVRRYLDFKVGEVWNEISDELILDEVKPIESDAEALRSVRKTSEDTARRIMEEQARILEKQKEEEIREEMLVYAECQMKSHRKQRELAAKSWDTHVSRTSDYNILKEEKAQRKKYMGTEVMREEAERPSKHFVGHILAVETTGDQGPAGIHMKLARTSI